MNKPRSPIAKICKAGHEHGSPNAAQACDRTQASLALSAAKARKPYADELAFVHNHIGYAVARLRTALAEDAPIRETIEAAGDALIELRTAQHSNQIPEARGIVNMKLRTLDAAWTGISAICNKGHTHGTPDAAQACDIGQGLVNSKPATVSYSFVANPNYERERATGIDAAPFLPANHVAAAIEASASIAQHNTALRTALAALIDSCIGRTDSDGYIDLRHPTRSTFNTTRAVLGDFRPPVMLAILDCDALTLTTCTLAEFEADNVDDPATIEQARALSQDRKPKFKDGGLDCFDVGGGAAPHIRIFRTA